MVWILEGCGSQALVIGSRDSGAPDAAPPVDTSAGRPDANPPDVLPEVPDGGCLTPLPPVNTEFLSTGVTVGDMNGDGKVDMLAGVQAYLGNGDGTFEPTNSPLYGAPPVALGDLNGDGKLDVVTDSVVGNAVSVFLGLGDGNFQPPANQALSARPASLLVTDLDRDGHLDLAIVTPFTAGAAGVSVALGNGDATFRTAVSYKLPSGFAPEIGSLTAADFDHDGHQDLVLCASGSNAISLLRGVGNGTLAAPATFGTGAGSWPVALAVGDLSGDGNPDVAVANIATSTAGVLLGNGDGTFQSVAQYPTGSNAENVLIADINQDGRSDLVYAMGGAFAVLFADGEGGFRAPVTSRVDLVDPEGMVSADVTGDGKAEVLVADRLAGVVRVFRNTCGR